MQRIVPLCVAPRATARPSSRSTRRLPNGQALLCCRVNHPIPSSFAAGVWLRRLSTDNRSLLEPTIIYSDNHILVVNKPPGWHTVPNNPDHPSSIRKQNLKEGKGTLSARSAIGVSRKNNPSVNDKTTIATQFKSKCLLTRLQENRWGGGSQKDFLKPLHRIDQPCSGVVLLAKTSKAATRISKVWKDQQVHKSYLCLVQPRDIDQLKANSVFMPLRDDKDSKAHGDKINVRSDNKSVTCWKLEGYMLKRKKELEPRRSADVTDDRNGVARQSNPVGWSVIMTSNDPRPREEARRVFIQWQPIMPNLILVETNQGARHLVRALLAHIGGCPVQGDSRYGSQGSLQDFSVGLHAHSITLPDNLQLGSTTQRHFEAPIPISWRHLQGGRIMEEGVYEAITGNRREEAKTAKTKKKKTI
jgi:23S rRNA-/tRNA-specific pseudouridylate synthase